MQNDEGQNMDLYIPRKCSATNRLTRPRIMHLCRSTLGIWMKLADTLANSLPLLSVDSYVLRAMLTVLLTDWQKKKAEVRQQ